MEGDNIVKIDITFYIEFVNEFNPVLFCHHFSKEIVFSHKALDLP